MLRLFIAEDHPVFLEGLCTLLQIKDPSLKIVGTASNGRDAVAAIARLRPDIVLLDIVMEELDGIETTKVLLKEDPGLRIIMLTTFDDRTLIRQALDAGARAYILKDAPAEEIVSVIHSVDRGHVMLSDKAVRSLAVTGNVTADQNQFLADLRLQSTAESRRLNDLSPREREILMLVAQGKSNRVIAEALYISEKTVKNHVYRIYDTVEIHDRTALAVWYICNVLVTRMPST